MTNGAMHQRVLVVEDELIVADNLEWQLTQLGCKVVGLATSGEEAIALADETQPDIVMMDIQLQGRMDGLEAAKIIRQNTKAAVIFVSAYAAVFLRNPAAMVAPGICLSKPFSAHQLKAALRSTVAGLEKA